MGKAGAAAERESCSLLSKATILSSQIYLMIDLADSRACTMIHYIVLVLLHLS